MERYIPIFEDQSKTLVEKLRKFSNGQTEDVFPIFHAFALDVIAEGAMGVKLNSQMEPNSEFVQATAEYVILISGLGVFKKLYEEKMKNKS